MRTIIRSLAAATLLLTVGGAGAQTMDHGSMEGMDHGAMNHEAAASPSTEAYKKADMAMHEAMRQDYTGDADKDFLAGMIPHHQGAVEMARIVLRYGKDPKVKALAQSIIDGQTREIAEMKTMLGAPTRAACAASWG